MPYPLLAEIPQKEEPELLTLSRDAYLVFSDFYYYVEDRLNGEFYGMELWAGKIVGNAARIAGNLHCCIHQEESAKIPISGETMLGAVGIAKYFISYAKAVFDMIGDFDTPQEKDAKYILKRLEANGKSEISKRDLYQLCHGKFKTMDEMIEGLTLLELHGYLHTEKISTGGRPTETIILSPEYLSSRGGFH